jgi:phage terminase Nu1 subunit (DNA packaging protein)
MTWREAAEKRILTRRELASLLGVTPRHVGALEAQGLQTIDLGRKLHRYDFADVERFLEARKRRHAASDGRGLRRGRREPSRRPSAPRAVAAKYGPRPASID